HPSQRRRGGGNLEGKRCRASGGGRRRSTCRRARRGCRRARRRCPCVAATCPARRHEAGKAEGNLCQERSSSMHQQASWRSNCATVYSGKEMLSVFDRLHYVITPCSRRWVG